MEGSTILHLPLAVVPDASKAFDIICVGAIVGLLVVTLARFFMRKLPDGLFPTLVLAPLGSIVPIWIGYQFELIGSPGGAVCVAFLLGGPVLLVYLYGLATKKRR
jgi:uncharacterized membrane protein YeaQ/YmgE (transglycosylase-associated protein family)